MRVSKNQLKPIAAALLALSGSTVSVAYAQTGADSGAVATSEGITRRARSGALIRRVS